MVDYLNITFDSEVYTLINHFESILVPILLKK